jgi:uncharacterized Fe-S cluster protein YjdI
MQEYKNDMLIVRYDPAICIHAGECVRGLPSVFNVAKKPWIDVNGASPRGELIDRPAHSRLKNGQCPTHGRRRAVDLRPIVLLVPFGPWAAHVVPFRAIVIDQRANQRLP